MSNYDNYQEEDFFRDYPRANRDPELENSKLKDNKKEGFGWIKWLFLLLLFLLFFYFKPILKIGERAYQKFAPKQYKLEEVITISPEENAYLNSSSYIDSDSGDVKVTKVSSKDVPADKIANKIYTITKTNQLQGEKEVFQNTGKVPGTTATTTKRGNHSVVAGSFRSAILAERQKQNLINKGFNATIRQVVVNNRTTNRLIIGSNLSYQEALNIKNKAAQLGYDVFIVNP